MRTKNTRNLGRYLTRIIIRSRFQAFRIILLFIIMTIAGYLSYHNLESFIEYFSKYLGTAISGKSFLGIALFIILNNIKVSFLTVLLGITYIFPYITLVTNSLILGAALRVSAEKNGVLSMLKILPHGIFEVPALLLSIIIGLNIAHSVLFREKTIVKAYKDAFYLFFLVAVPLFIIAGIIEASMIMLIK